MIDLAEGSLELVGRFPWASNATFLARVEGASGVRPVVYKPRAGERPLWDFPAGSLCEREVAAYELSEALGWRIVPPTVIREGPLGDGTVQPYIEHDPNETFFTLLPERRARFTQFALFDVVANNADRKAGHCLRETVTDHVWGVDHGLTFHAEPKLRTVIWEFAGEPIPAELLEDLSRVGGEVGERLADLLDPLEVEAVLVRIDGLTTDSVFPMPTGDRPYPWPLV